MFIKVKVATSAKHESVKKISEDHYNISVKEPAERNLANKRICEIIAAELMINKGSVHIIKGHKSSSKILSIIL